ncbi:MAG: di-trans,poly-cis-decaprenylcistransferase [Actinobacteria bacterium]|nr:di-trans,poly-cis-decaprenylcistransferase [Actinomycetota bacterium]
MTDNKLKIPENVAIIMDGNGRWATSKGLSRIEGHKAGEQSVVTTARKASDLGIKALTLYAFSTENWKRPPDEVEFLMHFNAEILGMRVTEFHSRNMKIRFLGRRDPLPDMLLRKMDDSTELTRNNTGMKLNIALNYGARAELVDAMREIAVQVRNGDLEPGEIEEETISSHLYAPDLSHYDLMIRTAGEMRISNFLLWELAYTELYVTDTLWPDFRGENLEEAIDVFNQRVRKYGDVVE